MGWLTSAWTKKERKLQPASGIFIKYTVSHNTLRLINSVCSSDIRATRCRPSPDVVEGIIRPLLSFTYTLFYNGTCNCVIQTSHLWPHLHPKLSWSGHLHNAPSLRPWLSPHEPTTYASWWHPQVCLTLWTTVLINRIREPSKSAWRVYLVVVFPGFGGGFCVRSCIL